MIQTTVLHPKHLEAGAKMVDFHGWEMPINYGSQLEEHHQCAPMPACSTSPT